MRYPVVLLVASLLVLPGCLGPGDDAGPRAMAMPSGESPVEPKPQAETPSGADAEGSATPANTTPNTTPTSAAQEQAPDGNETPPALVWALQDCHAWDVLLPVRSDDLTPHLPDGFRALTIEEAGLPPDPRGDALLIVMVGRCASSVSDYAELSDVPLGFYATIVEPPAEYEVEGVHEHLVLWDALVEDEALRAVLSAAGLPARAGAVVTEDLPVEPVVPGFAHADLVFEGEGLQEVIGATPVPGEQHSLPHAAYVETPNGLSRWSFDFQVPTTALGGVWYESGPGTFPASLVGTEPYPAVGVLEVGTFEATIELEL